MALSANHARHVCDPLLNPDPLLTGVYVVQDILQDH